jgi:hypothetical protein
VSALTSAVTTIVAVVGLLGLYLQVRQYNEAAGQESERKVRDAFAKLYPMDMEVWKFIGQNGRLKSAFIADEKGAVWRDLSDDEKGRFDAASQMMGDMFEYYLLVQPDLVENKWASHNDCWAAYMAMIYRQSAGFRDFISRTEGEWTPTFKEQIKQIQSDGK